jgi:hypothetical protein
MQKKDNSYTVSHGLKILYCFRIYTDNNAELSTGKYWHNKKAKLYLQLYSGWHGWHGWHGLSWFKMGYYGPGQF